MSSRQLLPTAVALAGFALAGCETTSTSPKKAATAESDYEYVTPLGSNIPVRVKKGTAANTPSPTETMTGEQAANMIQRAGASTPDRGR